MHWECTGWFRSISSWRHYDQTGVRMLREDAVEIMHPLEHHRVNNLAARLFTWCNLLPYWLCLLLLLNGEGFIYFLKKWNIVSVKASEWPAWPCLYDPNHLHMLQGTRVFFSSSELSQASSSFRSFSCVFEAVSMCKAACDLHCLIISVCWGLLGEIML